MTDIFQGSSAGNTGNTYSEPLADGHYAELRVTEIRSFNAKTSGVPCFKVGLEVIMPANGHKAGDRSECFEKLAGAKFPSYDVESRGRVRRFLGALAGLEKPADIDQQVTMKDFEVATSDAQPFIGAVVSAVVKSKTNKEGVRFATYLFSPVLDANGKPKTAVAVSAPSAPPPPSAPAAPTPPAADPYSVANGWFDHPQMPGHKYNAAGNIVEVATGRKVA